MKDSKTKNLQPEEGSKSELLKEVAKRAISDRKIENKKSSKIWSIFSKKNQAKPTEITAKDIANLYNTHFGILYASIPKSELIKSITAEKRDPKNIHFNTFQQSARQLDYLVSIDILNKPSLAESALAMKYWIDVLRKCEKDKNYTAMVSIVNALIHPSITRLKLVKMNENDNDNNREYFLSSEDSNLLNRLQAKISKNITTQLLIEMEQDINTNKTFVPYVDIYQKKAQLAAESNALELDGAVDDAARLELEKEHKKTQENVLTVPLHCQENLKTYRSKGTFDEEQAYVDSITYKLFDQLSKLLASLPSAMDGAPTYDVGELAQCKDKISAIANMDDPEERTENMRMLLDGASKEKSAVENTKETILYHASLAKMPNLKCDITDQLKKYKQIKDNKFTLETGRSRSITRGESLKDMYPNGHPFRVKDNGKTKENSLTPDSSPKSSSSSPLSTSGSSSSDGEWVSSTPPSSSESPRDNSIGNYRRRS